MIWGVRYGCRKELLEKREEQECTTTACIVECTFRAAVPIRVTVHAREESCCVF
jgi:hypothetical protein